MNAIDGAGDCTSLGTVWTCGRKLRRISGMKSTLAERIRAAMDAKGLNPHSLERKTGGLWGRNVTTRMRNGEDDALAEKWTTLADLLGVSLDYLLAGRGPGPEAGMPRGADEEDDGKKLPLLLVLVDAIGMDEAIRRLANAPGSGKGTIVSRRHRGSRGGVEEFDTLPEHES